MSKNSFSERYIHMARVLLPMPFTIAIILTIIAFGFAFSIYESSTDSRVLDLLGFWEKGLWNKQLLAFGAQCMFMLVMGYVLAISKPVNTLINSLTGLTKSASVSFVVVTLASLIFSWINWGLGLIVGAILARKMAERLSKDNIPFNYGLLGAAAYSGMMVWHGGLSGSAPLKVAESDHFFVDQIGVLSSSETLFSSMNIGITMMLFIAIPILVFLLSKMGEDKQEHIKVSSLSNEENHEEDLIGMERVDHSSIVSKVIGGGILVYALYKLLLLDQGLSLNFINLVLFGLALSLHQHFTAFIAAVDKAISSASGILIQFPLYFGIMGLIKDAGIAQHISDFFVEISNSFTYPIYTFLSAGIVNVFVPSGGGQWAVQGQIIIDAAKSLNVNVAKAIMAMAYGDQLTNMLQPFWALPLLGITGLKAKEILPYTLLIMLLGMLIFITGLIVF